MNPLALPSLLLALAVMALSYWAGDHNRNNAWLAKQATAESQAREALQAASAQGDVLTRRLLQQTNTIDQIKTERLHAIPLATTGSPCLYGPALRLLDSAPGLHVSNVGWLPAPTGGAVAAGGYASSDTDVAVWAVDSAARFEVCRARLDALIDWHSPTPKEPYDY
jgi:hypothetical protein